MIKKIVSIKNTGKFRLFSAHGKGNVSLNRMNIIYSENGRGKTTLSHIFRSLSEQNGAFLIGRKTLGASEEQSIEILCDSTNYKFKDGKWEKKPEFEFEIFDSYYISQNIYSKNIIQHDQKKQLYLFTIGQQGVEKANQLDEIETKIKLTNANKKELESNMMVDVQGVQSLNDFINLPNKDSIEEEIQKHEKLLLALGKESEIKSKSALSRLNLPSFDKERFETNLAGSTIATILDSTEELTKHHIKDILDENGEKWLEYGVGKIQNEYCPFCKQDIRDIKIVKAFKTFFSAEYKKTIQVIRTLELAFQQKFNFEILSNLQSSANINLGLMAFWQKYINLNEEPTLSIENINNTWNAFTSGIKQTIEEKKRSPLEQIILSEEINDNIDKYQEILTVITKYNELIDKINQTIEERKLSVDQLSLQNVRVALGRLKNTQLRYSQAKHELIETYKSLLLSIKSLTTLKSRIKTELNSYTEDIFRKYEERINWYLGNCGASFKVSDYNSNFQGGKPSSNFTLSINNCPVSLGNDNSPLTIPTFGNTLSEGDKSSLAFAFFLARLETDPDIAKKVLIFDDPISSLDNIRKSYTADQIIRYSSIAKQVIVLTHDSYFARTIWGKFALKKTLLTQMCIRREGKFDSTIETWDIENETRSDYYQSYFSLADFLEGKSNLNLRAVAMCIRPLIEGNLRIRFPLEFKSDEWLGDFIDKVRNAINDPLLRMRAQLSELEDINDYSKKFHHDKSPTADTEPIIEQELLAYVSRTLKVLQGVHNVY